MVRLVVEGAIYHVYGRGNNKFKIFHVGYDYAKYKRNLVKYKSQYLFKLYSYAMLPNHLHLLIEPKLPGDLSKIMQSLNLSYAKWHNKRYDCVGHVWQGRYGDRVIKNDQNLISCMAYIENNPVKAGLVEDPGAYKWSSCHERFHNMKDSLIDFHPTYLALGESDQERKRIYYSYISS